MNSMHASLLVPGDIVELNPGDRVPADLRVVEEVDLEMDEATLTGESQLVSKTTESQAVASKEDLSSMTNIVFMSTIVVNGRGKGVVVATASATEFGKVFAMMQDVEKEKTPLQNSMDKLGKQLSAMSIGLIAVIVLVGWLQNKPFLEMFHQLSRCYRFGRKWQTQVPWWGRNTRGLRTEPKNLLSAQTRSLMSRLWPQAAWFW